MGSILHNQTCQALTGNPLEETDESIPCAVFNHWRTFQKNQMLHVKNVTDILTNHQDSSDELGPPIPPFLFRGGGLGLEKCELTCSGGARPIPGMPPSPLRLPLELELYEHGELAHRVRSTEMKERTNCPSEAVLKGIGMPFRTVSQIKMRSLGIFRLELIISSFHECNGHSCQLTSFMSYSSINQALASWTYCMHSFAFSPPPSSSFEPLSSNDTFETISGVIVRPANPTNSLR